MIKNSAVSFVKLASSFPFDCIERENATYSRKHRQNSASKFYVYFIFTKYLYSVRIRADSFIRTVLMKFTFCFSTV